MRLRHLPFLAVIFMFTSCVSLREGNVVEKMSRRGMANAVSTWLSMNYNEPDVYWVEIEGRDDRGVTRKKSVILFRHDWEQLRVGDHWDSETGFAPCETDAK